MPDVDVDWPAHWEQQKQPWRREPPIGRDEQRRLHGLMAVAGMHSAPFMGETLTRADIEWLIEKPEHRQIPAGGSGGSASTQPGLNLAGATLSHVDLSYLPLAQRIDESLGPASLHAGNAVRPTGAVVSLAGASLHGTILEKIDLRCANLSGATFYDPSALQPPSANLRGAYLAHANLSKVRLRNADLRDADLSSSILRGAALDGAHLQNAILNNAHLEPYDADNITSLNKAYLDGAQLRGAILYKTILEGAYLRSETDLSRAYLIGARLNEAILTRAKLINAHLQWANMREAELCGANFTGARLAQADLTKANLERADLTGAHFAGYLPEDELWKSERESITTMIGLQEDAIPKAVGAATLSRATMDARTVLTSTTILANAAASVSLADIVWNDVDVSAVDWSDLRRFGVGEQRMLRLLYQPWTRYRPRRIVHGNMAPNGPSSPGAPRHDHEPLLRAMRTNYQLGMKLRSSGLTSEAADFALRGRQLETRYLWEARKLRFIPQIFLGIFTGYGYSVMRAFSSYVVVICLYACIYWLVGVQEWGFRLKGPPQHLSFVEAVITSVYAFHGRGLFSSTTVVNAQAAIGATEAGVGLLLEVNFIAAFTQRFLLR